MNLEKPILTIAIPTWNRAPYLRLTLDQLAKELASCERGLVELMVSDNACEDNTEEVVKAAIGRGDDIRYIRNATNIGSDANIAQCFNFARGHYVLILGDDDLLVDDALPWLLDKLLQKEFGVVCLRAYGYDNNFRLEYPHTSSAKEKEYTQVGNFLASAGPLTALISSCVINKKILGNTDATVFCGGNLVQVHLVFRAAIKAKVNVMTENYCVAYKRNNWGYYDFSKVFVMEFGKILDQYKNALGVASIRKIETKFLFSYFPFYLWKQRLLRSGDLGLTCQRFTERFSGRPLFQLWVLPLLTWPRPFALVWGVVAIFFGRSLSGDFRRGLWFVWNRILRWRVRQI